MKATATQSSNYPQEVIDSMVAAYEAAPTRTTVNALAAEFDTVSYTHLTLPTKA